MKQSYTIDEIGILLEGMPKMSFDLCMTFVENSFRICVRGAESGEIIYFRQYHFLQITQFNDALHELKEIVATDTLFASVYKAIRIGYSGRAELTPIEFFKPIETGYLYESLNDLQIMISVPIDEAQSEFYSAFFPSAIPCILPLQWMKIVLPLAANTSMFVNFDGHLMSVLYALSSSQILFFNTFEFRTSEDFAYYINLVAQELQINREDCNLVLSGDIAFPSQLYSIAYTYFNKVSFLKNDSLPLTKLFATYPKHQNIHLFSL